MSIRVERYKSSDKLSWNAFVDSSNQNSFLFQRDFMEYHSNRFEDFSLLIYDDAELVSLLPGHKKDQKFISHNGLSYGGFVLKRRLKFEKVLSIVCSVLTFLDALNISQINIKMIPQIYQTSNDASVEYILRLFDAILYRTEMLSVVNPGNNSNFSKDRLAGYKRGVKNNLEFKEEDNINVFWDKLLIPNLHLKHEVNPVHNSHEMNRLKSSFNKEIRQFGVYHNNSLVAGTIIFDTKMVAHSQYIASNSDKNKLGSLDFLHVLLIKKVFNHKYFDFGISSEMDGKVINKGLLYWKQGFGTSSYIQNFYELETGNFKRANRIVK